MPAAGYTKRVAVWTPEAVIDKAQQFNEAHGQPPAATDWNPSDCLRASRVSADRARRWAERAERFYSSGYPWTGTVAKLFGGWNDMLRAAGLPVRWEGKRGGTLDQVTTGLLDTDELRSLVDEAEDAMAGNDTAALRARLLTLADRALAWANEVPNE